MKRDPATADCGLEGWCIALLEDHARSLAQTGQFARFWYIIYAETAN
jgi:hypothetical protein